MYTKEQKEHALKEYERLGSVQATITYLGYPSRHTLYDWHRNMLANKQNYHGSPNKPYQIQQKYINAPEHPRYPDINLKLEAIKQPDKYSHIRKKIIELFNENRKCYGYRRIHRELKRLGTTISEKIVRDIMKSENLLVMSKRQKKYSSYKGEITPEVENVINRDFHAEKPNQKWLTDITEFAIPSGKVYLSPIIDCFDGMVVKWNIGTTPDSILVNKMLEDAIGTLSTSEHPLVHTDRGCHYRWPGWIKRMEAAELTRSMSKKGCSPDNAACEGFFGRLKNEMFYGRSWIGVSMDDFINEINDYITWYNTKRIKQSLGYMSPVEYRHNLGLAA